jgi:hypothetical protein
VQVVSRRVNTQLALQRSKDAIRLTKPGTAEVEVPAEWANRYLVAPGADGRPASIQFTEAMKVSLALSKLAIASGETPLKPGVFALDASAALPAVKVRTADGRAVDMQSISASLRDDAPARGIAFDLNAKSVGVAGAGASRPVQAKGTVADLADESGRLTADRAAVTARVDGSMPTAVIDALGNQQGMLVDLLGAMTAIQFNADRLSRTGGTMAARVDTDNANANVRGAVREATFVTEGQTTITLSRITPELSRRFIETAIPIIARVEKTNEDEPATVLATGVTVPTDGDTRKINGRATVDLGTVQFDTSSIFGQVVKVVGGKDKGRIGRRIKPFEFTAEQGVVRYEKVELPLGEFMIATQGKVDLNTRTMDILTMVPFSALASEIAGQLANIPGLEALTMIPIRTHGSFDKPKNEVQMDLIVREAIPGAIEKAIPEDIKKVIPPEIGEGLKDLFKKKKN